MTGDEHDDYGHITENPEIRRKMHEKRMGKYRLMLEQIPEEKQFSLVGESEADLTFVCWGTTLGVLKDALPLLKDRGIRVNCLNFRMLNPFPIATEAILRKAKKLVLVENNLGAQLGQLIRMRTGLHLSRQVLKYTGRPISLNEAVAAAERFSKDEVQGEKDPLSGQTVEKVVLTYGL